LPPNSEGFSRVLIDAALKDSDWDLLDPNRVRFELKAGGRAEAAQLHRAARARLDALNAAMPARAFRGEL
jgi:hypothetical protein